MISPHAQDGSRPPGKGRKSISLEKAIAFASRAHEGQQYGDGPYILHPLRVMMSVRPRARVAAVLHDCKEDAGILPRGLSDVDLGAVDLLTRPSAMKYRDYVARMAEARGLAADIAREVKLSDLQDNLAHMTVEKEHLLPRYRAAVEVLNAVPEGIRQTCKFCGFPYGLGECCPDCREECICNWVVGLGATLRCPVHGVPPYRMEYHKGVH